MSRGRDDPKSISFSGLAMPDLHPLRVSQFVRSKAEGLKPFSGQGLTATARRNILAFGLVRRRKARNGHSRAGGPMAARAIGTFRAGIQGSEEQLRPCGSRSVLRCYRQRRRRTLSAGNCRQASSPGCRQRRFSRRKPDYRMVVQQQFPLRGRHSRKARRGSIVAKGPAAATHLAPFGLAPTLP